MKYESHARSLLAPCNEHSLAAGNMGWGVGAELFTDRNRPHSTQVCDKVCYFHTAPWVALRRGLPTNVLEAVGLRRGSKEPQVSSTRQGYSTGDQLWDSDRADKVGHTHASGLDRII